MRPSPWRQLWFAAGCHVFCPEPISAAGEAKILVAYDGQADLTTQEIKEQLQTALQVLVFGLSQTYGH